MKKLKKYTFLSVLTFVFLIPATISFGQNTEFKHYKDLKNNFSFDISETWRIYYSNRLEDIVCAPTKPKEKEDYKDCFEGVIFRVDIYKSGLDSTLLNRNYYKINNDYYKTDRFHDSVKTKPINGKTWKGIYHNNVCGISCVETGFHAGAGECEFLYFSNDLTTICINTNGRAFDKKILKRIIATFYFLKS